MPVNVNLATLASDYETSLGNLLRALAGTGSYAATNGSITVSGGHGPPSRFRRPRAGR